MAEVAPSGEGVQPVRPMAPPEPTPTEADPLYSPVPSGMRINADTNMPMYADTSRDNAGYKIITPEQAAEHLLRMERMKREREAYVNRLVRSQ